MNKLNNVLEQLASPLKKYSTWLLRIGLGTSFFLHGYGKIPIQQSFIDWLAAKGVPFADTTAHLIAWGEILSGIGILLGGVIGAKAHVIGNESKAVPPRVAVFDMEKGFSKIDVKPGR